ncbi:MAG: tRNA pseudouridine(38-40) synthase TruA [Anaerolineae bacterium]|nr:tRNA pseudouridine(38-40) synthase TruA [Anaerolineae bacterium]
MSAASRLADYLRATVAYDGTDFHGFQVQVGQRTVQGELERALATITQTETRVIGAGRTDSGVHALGQVVAFHTEWQHPIDALQRGWNALLAQDVTILSLNWAQEGFHPRFSAKSRVYRYTIWNHPIRNPLLRRTAFWVSQPLDVEAMKKAAQLLVGEHDFATFGQPPQGTSTIRRVIRTAWTGEENTLYFDIEANAFLYRMVRGIVGTLLQVGKNDLSVKAFADRFAAADRSQAGPTAPASGLCLMAACY